MIGRTEPRSPSTVPSDHEKRDTEPGSIGARNSAAVAWMSWKLPDCFSFNADRSPPGHPGKARIGARFYTNRRFTSNPAQHPLPASPYSPLARSNPLPASPYSPLAGGESCLTPLLAKEGCPAGVGWCFWCPAGVGWCFWCPAGLGWSFWCPQGCGGNSGARAGVAAPAPRRTALFCSQPKPSLMAINTASAS